MEIRIDSKLQEEIRKINKKQLNLFSIDPKHKSLRVHKLSGELKQLWSISINKEIRMVYVQEKDVVYFSDIGTHDEVYRK